VFTEALARTEIFSMLPEENTPIFPVRLSAGNKNFLAKLGVCRVLSKRFSHN
jgi:hypothetical protein